MLFHSNGQILAGVYTPITVADWECPQLKSIHKERQTLGFSLSQGQVEN